MVRSGFLAIMAIVGVASQVAVAADMPIKSPPPPPAAPVADWTGIYFGLNGGYGWGDAEYTSGIGSAISTFRLPSGWTCPTTTPSCVVTTYDAGTPVYAILAPGDTFAGPPGTVDRHHIKGGMFGGHLGANFQAGVVVFGLETSFDWSGVRGTTGEIQLYTFTFPSGCCTNPSGTTNQTPPVATGIHGIFKTDVKWLATATPRFGISPTNNWLLYVKGGLAAARLDVYATRTDGGSVAPPLVSANGQFWSDSMQRYGYTVGAGLEYALTRNFIIGVEGNYYNLGTAHSGGTMTAPGGGIGTIQFNEDVKVAFWNVLGRLSYKIDWTNPVR